MVIIPGQRKVVADLIAGRTPDPVHGRRGKQRSTHNNYLTLPVVFVMISGHYPLAYATRWSWVILALLLVMGGVMRHFFNLRHQGKPTLGGRGAWRSCAGSRSSGSPRWGRRSRSARGPSARRRPPRAL
jgi:uncharacterized membrane protein